MLHLNVVDAWKMASASHILDVISLQFDEKKIDLALKKKKKSCRITVSEICLKRAAGGYKWNYEPICMIMFQILVQRGTHYSPHYIPSH